MSDLPMSDLPMSDPPIFEPAFRSRLHDLFRWRRDVRHFRPDPLPAGLLDELLAVASLAPSVGLSEPWRFVVVEDRARREAVRASFERCNAAALADQTDEAAGLYARLKLAGLADAPVHLGVFADAATAQGRGLGRQTMPATLAYSAVLAIHTVWLAARAEGIGLGWVSILEPALIADVLDVPPAWTFVGYLCLGYPACDDTEPELQRRGWETRRPQLAHVLRR